MSNFWGVCHLHCPSHDSNPAEKSGFDDSLVSALSALTESEGKVEVGRDSNEGFITLRETHISFVSSLSRAMRLA